MPTTVTAEQVETRVFEALVEFGADQGALAREAEFEALGVDSLDLVELVQIVDDEFGVQLKSEDMNDVRTVGQALDLVITRLP
jgi:acyl carrier protein